MNILGFSATIRHDVICVLPLALRLLLAGGDRSVLLRHILCRSALQGRRSWFRPAQGLVSAQRLEHDGLRGGRHRVSEFGCTDRVHVVSPFELGSHQ